MTALREVEGGVLIRGRFRGGDAMNDTERYAMLDVIAESVQLIRDPEAAPEWFRYPLQDDRGPMYCLGWGTLDRALFGPLPEGPDEALIKVYRSAMQVLGREILEVPSV